MLILTIAVDTLLHLGDADPGIDSCRAQRTHQTRPRACRTCGGIQRSPVRHMLPVNGCRQLVCLLCDAASLLTRTAIITCSIRHASASAQQQHVHDGMPAGSLESSGTSPLLWHWGSADKNTQSVGLVRRAQSRHSWTLSDQGKCMGGAAPCPGDTSLPGHDMRPAQHRLEAQLGLQLGTWSPPCTYSTDNANSAQCLVGPTCHVPAEKLPCRQRRTLT